MVQIDGNTVVAIIGLAGAGGTAVGAWVMSVERLKNDVKYMRTTVNKIDRRTEKMSRFIAGRDVFTDADAEAVEAEGERT